jgi:hydroxymethylpyrimidine pyrophosphatase-like HAD family hydrolase
MYFCHDIEMLAAVGEGVAMSNARCVQESLASNSIQFVCLNLTMR